MADSSRSPTEAHSGPSRISECSAPAAPTIDSGDSLRVTQGQPKSGAERTRRWRQRRKAQLRVLMIEVDECDLADALLASGALEHVKADDPAELASALSRVVKRWAAASV